MKRKKIQVFFAVDDNYVDYLLITLKSIMISSKDEQYCYNFNILHNGLSMESKKRISKLMHSRFKATFFHVGGHLNQTFNRFKLRDYYTITTYYRILIPDAFFYIDKAIYLDCDIVVLEDLSHLYNYELAGKLVGAVPDQSVGIFDEFKTYVKKALNIEPEKYFNAGVLLMNLKAMRQEHMLRRIVELSKSTVFKVAQDQDLLNTICKDKVRYLPNNWNVMPVGSEHTDLSLIHYNLIFKPWKHKDTLYKDYFWYFAKEVGLDEKIKEGLNSMSDEYFKNEEEGMNNLKKLCIYESEKPEHYEKCLTINDEGIDYSLSIERAEIYDKIKLLEEEGKFDVDVENDPPYVPLKPGDVDYTHKKIRTKIYAKIYDDFSFRYFNKQIKKQNIIIDGYKGLEYLKYLKSGAIITSNHFNPFDSIPIHKAVKKYHYKKTLFKIIKEGNYTFPGLYGKFMRYCNTLPLANNYEVLKDMMNGVEYWLKKGYCILIYPEQSMWWNYKKPKPTKHGAFRFAAKFNYPVIPTFITLRDTGKVNSEGDTIYAYTLNILKPIYPHEGKTLKENVEYLQTEHDKAWKEVYEKTYNTKLEYRTKE